MKPETQEESHCYSERPAEVKLIYKHAGENFQMVIAQVGKVKCGVVYISPKATRTETEECLRMLNTHSRGNSIIGGDWNARHKQWTKSNRRGNQLARMGHREEMGDSTSKRTNL